MATNEMVAAPANSERGLSIDRLTRIDGIARKTAEAMCEIGFQDYAGLAQYLSQHTAEEVSAALKEHGVNRPPAFIDRAAWVKQARELGELKSTAPASPEEEAEPTQELEGAPTSRDSREHDAVFTVFFDVATDGDRGPVLSTTVCDGANGDQEGVFEGDGTAPWVNWILERANLPFAVEDIATQAEMTGEPPPSEIEAATPPVPMGPGDTHLEIGDVGLSVIEPTANGPEKRLKAEINFQLSGTGAETLASKGVPFRIEGYTVDIESGVSELVAIDQSQLAPQVFEYIGQQEFGIPDVGHYEFHTIVLLLPPGESVAYHRGPTMRVVP